MIWEVVNQLDGANVGWQRLAGTLAPPLHASFVTPQCHSSLVTFARFRYAARVLWKKTWQPEIVMALIGGLVLAFFSASLLAELLRHFDVVGFRKSGDAGSVLLVTLSFHGAAIVMAVLFLKLHDIRWRDALGWQDAQLKKHLLITGILLLAVTPVMIDLKIASEILLEKIGRPVADQLAVEMFSNAKSLGLRVYLGIFAVIIAPVAEEFVFRGLIFSGLKKLGWPKCGWFVASLLFAAIHGSAPVFLPLFVFALALTWLYERTEGLLAPMLAHGLFNAANLIILLSQTE